MELGWTHVPPILHQWNRFRFENAQNLDLYQDFLRGYMQECFALRSWYYRWFYEFVLNGIHTSLGQGIRSCIWEPISGNQFGSEFKYFEGIKWSFNPFRQISGAWLGRFFGNFIQLLFLPVWVRVQENPRVSQQLWHVLLVPIELRNHQTDRIHLRLIFFFFCLGILSIHLKMILK